MRKIVQFIPGALLVLIAWAFPSSLWSNPADPNLSRKEITLPEYIVDLRTASAALDRGSPSAIHDLRTSLTSEWVVQTGGQSITVKTDWLATALLAKEKAPDENARLLRDARERLTAMRESAESLSAPASGVELGKAHAQVDHILRGREFQGSHEPTWLDKLKARVSLWISRQLNKLFGRMGISATVGNVIAWIVVSLAGLLLALWTVRFLLSAAARSELALGEVTPAGRDWRYWAREARAAAERGDFREAIHAAYWTAVAQLEEINLLPEDRSRTPRESLRLLRRLNSAYTPLAQLTRRFELTWYGYKAATPQDWDEATRELEALECLRSSTRATASS